MKNWTAAPMAAQERQKGEPSSASMRYRLRAQPAHLVRGSSRRIMTMRFRPANIRVINRRVCSWAVIGTAVHNERSKPTSGNVFPPGRPSTLWWDVPERCSASRVRFAAPNPGAPLTPPRRSGEMVIATGGSGGNTRRCAAPRQKRRLPCGSRLIQKILSGVTKLDRVAPYQKLTEISGLLLEDIESTAGAEATL